MRLVLAWPPVLQAEGVDVVVLLKDRRLYVGKLVGSIDCGAVQLALWGCGGAVTSFPTSLVVCFDRGAPRLPRRARGA